MSVEPLSSVARARIPVQERSQQRVAQIIEAAEHLLVKLGPEETSIPEIAKLTGIPRASIYQFFPNKYALFNHLAEYYLGQVSEAIKQLGASCHDLSWQQATSVLVQGSSAFYNQSPIASMLVLGGPFSRSAYMAQEVTIVNIGQSVRQLFANLAQPFNPPCTPDTATYAVEIAFACMKHGYYEDGSITEGTQEQATHAAVAYLSRWQ
ncbi:MAG: TetR/AcrR family transcriptional regulator [Moraxellaceae bacterium]|nr:TetR/AcrR family transcriptional regulator [Moraxellaceae bacterium]MDP1775827.1 TetR/AcrR family transcriptional regulator [Moraxellaceae bacterium]